MSGAAIELAAARMPKPSRALQRGDRVVCMFFSIGASFYYRRGRILALAAGRRVTVKFADFYVPEDVPADCCALEEGRDEDGA
jgi:hypothetical protein